MGYVQASPMKEVFTRSLRFQTMELGWLERGILIEFERIKDAEGEPVEPVEPVAKRRKLIEGDTEWSLTRIGRPLHPLSLGQLCCGRIIHGGDQCVITRSIKKDMMIYDIQKSQKVPLRSFAFCATPNAIFAVPKDAASRLANGLIVAEGRQLSIWDPRVQESGGLVHRVQVCFHVPLLSFVIKGSFIHFM
jgi:hypothetical protein